MSVEQIFNYPLSHPVISFNNYVRLYSQTSTLQERVALLFTGTSALNNVNYTVEDPLSVEAGIIYNFTYSTVDGIVYSSTGVISCQKKIRINVVLSRNFDTDFKRTNCGSLSINRKCKKYGDDTPNCQVDVKWLRFTTFQIRFWLFWWNSHLQIACLLPQNVFESAHRIQQAFKCKLTIEQRRRFIDEYFLSALESLVVPSVADKFHTDFNTAIPTRQACTAVYS